MAEEGEKDLEAVVVQFDEMMEKNPIKDLLEAMARRNRLEAREELESNRDVFLLKIKINLFFLYFKRYRFHSKCYIFKYEKNEIRLPSFIY